MTSYTFEPIGFVRSPFTSRVSAPRQAAAAQDTPGRIELLPGHGYEHALDGLAGWERIWILFVFHQNVEQGRGFRPKVLPPRSEVKQGVFATRSPHRPNPIGLSAVVLVRVEGLTVHVRGMDLLDATPVIDLKPYVPYADAFPEARSGWLAAVDPVIAWTVVLAEPALSQLEWLKENGVDLRPAIESTLALGPQPNPYRRIRPHGGAMRLAIKEWRADFVIEDRSLRVVALSSGYRPKELAAGAGLELHRAFAARWA